MFVFMQILNDKFFIFSGRGQSGQTDQCNAKQGRRKVKIWGGGHTTNRFAMGYLPTRSYLPQNRTSFMDVPYPYFYSLFCTTKIVGHGPPGPPPSPTQFRRHCIVHLLSRKMGQVSRMAAGQSSLDSKLLQQQLLWQNFKHRKIGPFVGKVLLDLAKKQLFPAKFFQKKNSSSLLTHNESTIDPKKIPP